jgi:hypothetical protein
MTFGMAAGRREPLETPIQPAYGAGKSQGNIKET